VILEPSVGSRVFFTDPDTHNPWSGWGTIKKVHGPRFVTLTLDDHSEIGAYTSELSTTEPAKKEAAA
jgi:hypothetical protein